MKHKNVSAIFINSLHCHITGSWNPSSRKTGTYLSYTVNIMGAEDLATEGVLTMLKRNNVAPHINGKLPVKKVVLLMFHKKWNGTMWSFMVHETREYMSCRRWAHYTAHIPYPQANPYTVLKCSCALEPKNFKISHLSKIHTFQCMGKLSCVELQSALLEFHTKDSWYIEKYIIFIERLKFESS